MFSRAHLGNPGFSNEFIRISPVNRSVLMENVPEKLLASHYQHFLGSVKSKREMGMNYEILRNGKIQQGSLLKCNLESLAKCAT